ncbi:MAG: Six-hairpin glycosidase-like protein [Piptocephalis tieghemiana]|nr:MAG: Six-hairpin glycosidase-like protein [Piptocephalis tieghemiana]
MIFSSWSTHVWVLIVCILLSIHQISQVQAQNNTTLASAGKGVSQANSEWSRVLSYSILFYEAQRSGKLPPDNRVDWRHDSALDDGKDLGLDLSGGWFDAGDYLKFTFPYAFTLTQLAWGGNVFWDGYVLSNQTNYFLSQMRWGYDWLIAAHPQPSTLVVQVGDGHVDNNYWGPDTNIPTPRPAFLINTDNPGTDVAGEAAAAFASGSLLFRQRFLNTAYADTLLQHAKDAFAFADSARYTLYQKSVSASEEYYASSAYEDEMCWAAAWLWKATGTSSYLDRAAAWIDSGKLRGKRSSVDWNTKTGACFILLASSNATDWASEAESYLDAVVAVQSPAKMTPGGLLWYSDASPADSTVPANNAIFLLFLYAESLPIGHPKRQKYLDFAQKQSDYMLGLNPEKTPYICGLHHNSPQNPHHAGASGGSDISNIRNSPPLNEHVLFGAVVGGPDEMDAFKDDRSDYLQNEVALDYNSPFQGWAARQVMYSTQDPPYVGLPNITPIGLMKAENYRLYYSGRIKSYTLR